MGFNFLCHYPLAAGHRFMDLFTGNFQLGFDRMGGAGMASLEHIGVCAAPLHLA